MNTLALRVTHRWPAAQATPAPAGLGTLERGRSRAFLLVPAPLEPERAYPLVTVLHGAGRQDELLATAYAPEAAERRALFLIPRSHHPTWDLLVGEEPHDLDFLAWAYAWIYERYRIDPARQSLVGYSDGASYALALALSNPRTFTAVAGWAAGFVVMDTAVVGADDPKPRVLLEHGTLDPVFPFEQIAVRNRLVLERLGYPVELRVDEGGVHWPSREFQTAALDFLLGGT